MKRLLSHLGSDFWTVRSAFPKATLNAIEATIAEQEKRHDGEVRFVVEAALPLTDLWARTSARDRAIELFSRLRVWDTEHNSGVLIYLLLADKRVEIVADRGIHARVGVQAWESICAEMQRAFREGRFEQGARIGIEAISDLLALHFPPREDNPDELPNRPIVL